jgi:hypothetical protein
VRSQFDVRHLIATGAIAVLVTLWIVSYLAPFAIGLGSGGPVFACGNGWLAIDLMTKVEQKGVHAIWHWGPFTDWRPSNATLWYLGHGVHICIAPKETLVSNGILPSHLLGAVHCAALVVGFVCLEIVYILVKRRFRNRVGFPILPKQA